DIDKVDVLIKAYKNGDIKEEIQRKTRDAIKPPLETIKLILEAMELSEFILKNGKIETISDGKIASRLMKEAIISSIINIEINQKHIDYTFDKEGIINKCESLYKRNE